MEAWVIDPGDYSNFLKNRIISQNLQLKGILLTHGHFDHILGIKILTQHFPDADICIHPSDAQYIGEGGLKKLHSFLQQVDPSLLEVVKDIEHDFPHPTHLFKDREVISGCELKVLHTPGHTSGGVCLYSERDGILFSGDTLFQNTVGRTDLPTGSTQDLITSIKTKLLTLNPRTIVYPGHGKETTIGREIKNNPFLR